MDLGKLAKSSQKCLQVLHYTDVLATRTNHSTPHCNDSVEKRSMPALLRPKSQTHERTSELLCSLLCLQSKGSMFTIAERYAHIANSQGMKNWSWLRAQSTQSEELEQTARKQLANSWSCWACPAKRVVHRSAVYVTHVNMACYTVIWLTCSKSKVWRKKYTFRIADTNVVIHTKRSNAPQEQINGDGSTCPQKWNSCRLRGRR
jgi:hypothetical protein